MNELTTVISIVGIAQQTLQREDASPGTFNADELEQLARRLTAASETLDAAAARIDAMVALRKSLQP